MAVVIISKAKIIKIEHDLHNEMNHKIHFDMINVLQLL